MEWHWDDAQETTLNQVKQKITREVTLQCNTSEYGLDAVIMKGGQPVAFSSRALRNTEKIYAQLEKELLSIVHGCIRFD